MDCAALDGGADEGEGLGGGDVNRKARSGDEVHCWNDLCGGCVVGGECAGGLDGGDCAEGDGNGAVGVVSGDEGALAVALLLDGDALCLADPAGVIFCGDLLEGCCKFCGALVLDFVGNDVCKAAGGRTRATYEAGDVADRGASFLKDAERVCEVLVGFAGEAYNKVRAEGKQRKALVEFVCQVDVVLGGVLAVHGLQGAFASALYRQVDELVHTIVLEAFHKGFLVLQDVAGIAHTKAHAVIAGNFYKDLLD